MASARWDHDHFPRFRELEKLSQLKICQDFILAFEDISGLRLSWRWVQVYFLEKDPVVVKGEISPLSCPMLQQGMVGHFQQMLATALARTARQYPPGDS